MNHITLKELSEAEIRFLSVHRDEFFWNIFYNGESGIALTDAQGNLLLANPQFARLVQRTPNKIGFHNLLQTCKGRQAEMDTGLLFHTQWDCLRISWVPLQNHATGAVYIWQVTKDVEAAVKNKMRELRKLYRSYIDNTFEWVFRTDMAGKILFSNKLFAKSLGFENYKQTKGILIQSIIDPLSFADILKTLESSGGLSSRKIQFRKSGALRMGLANISAFEEELHGTVLNWTVLDISHQTESEQALKRNNEELEKVNHQMEKFLYSTSHDLRSPISSIMGILNLMRMESQEPVLMDYLSKIEMSALRLDKIIRDIMVFSEITYKRACSEKIDPEVLIWETINDHKSDQQLRKIQCKVDVHGEFPFYCDSQCIKVIFENIIRNSIQFNDSNKAHSFINISVTLERAFAFFEIIDNGIGIGKQHLGSIFTMFYKATHLSKGAGLGLFIVKQTLEKLNGTVEVESEIGFGTVVKITIPNDHKGLLIGRKLELRGKS